MNAFGRVAGIRFYLYPILIRQFGSALEYLDFISGQQFADIIRKILYHLFLSGHHDGKV